jgi:hypothetical protein
VKRRYVPVGSITGCRSKPALCSIKGVPGHEVLMTQALPPPDGSPVDPSGGALLLNDTHGPVVIIETISDPSLDSGAQTVYQTAGDIVFRDNALRQYGCVDLMGRAEGYTGDRIKDYYVSVGLTETALGLNYTQEPITGKLDTFTFSAQGNAISAPTVPTLVKNFEMEGCDLADLLYHALIATSHMTEIAVQADSAADFVGDVRCPGQNGAPGLGTFLHVDSADGTEVVHIDITESMVGVGNTGRPFGMFAAEYNTTWREANPCPGPDAPNTDAPTDSSSAGGGTTPFVWGTIPILVLLQQLV